MNEFNIFISNNPDEYARYSDGKGDTNVAKRFEGGAYKISESIMIGHGVNQVEDIKNSILVPKESSLYTKQDTFDDSLKNFIDFIKFEFEEFIVINSIIRIFVHFGGINPHEYEPLEYEINNFLTDNYCKDGKTWKLYAISDGNNRPEGFFKSKKIVVNNTIVEKITKELDELQKISFERIDKLNKRASPAEIAAAILCNIQDTIKDEDFEKIWKEIAEDERFCTLCANCLDNYSKEKIKDFTELNNDEKKKIYDAVLAKSPLKGDERGENE